MRNLETEELEQLKLVAEATANGGHHFISYEVGNSLRGLGLIAINTEIVEADKAAARITDPGKVALSSIAKKEAGGKPTKKATKKATKKVTKKAAKKAVKVEPEEPELILEELILEEQEAADVAEWPEEAEPIEETPISEFEISDNIPVPPRKSSTKYPFGVLEIGQSFFVPVSEKLPNPSKSLSTTCSAQKRKTGKRFVIREVTENGAKGARIWREY